MPTYNLAYILERTTERFPDREAVVCGAKRWTFAQLNAAADSVAAGLAARGIEPGDRVALSCVNSPDFTVAYFAILKAGATVVPLNVLLRAREIEFHLRDSGAKAYLCFDGTPELPIGAEGRAAFEAAENCRVFVPIASGLGIRGGIEPSLDTLVADNAPHTTVETDEDDVVRITGLVEKPSRENAPSNYAVIGRYVLRPEIFDILEKTPPGKGGEIQLTDALEGLASAPACTGGVHGVVFRGRRYDTGDRLDYLKAIVQLAVARDDLGPELLPWLREFAANAGPADTGSIPALPPVPLSPAARELLQIAGA